ncbi:MAG: hypothetical protein Q8O95_05215 [bacterium]|nr:hypothetical protein [bacterium]
MSARIVTEVSCYMKKAPGTLGLLSEEVAKAGVNIQGIQVYEGQLQSLLMLVVDKIEITEEVLRKMGTDLIARTDILEVDFPNRVGGFAGVAKVLGKNDINILSIYFSGTPHSSGDQDWCRIGYVKVDDVEKARRLLNEVESDHRHQRSLDSSHPEESREETHQIG